MNAKTFNYFRHTLLRAQNWQPRPEFDRVSEWWQAGGRGVCALVGMGGAGKTAIAERFLRILPGGLPPEPGVDKVDSLPQPHSNFAISFYDEAHPEDFFEALQMWLERTPRLTTVLAFNQIAFMLQGTPGLIVMDGLEKVQDDGARGAFGRITSPNLRNFLDQAAAGYFHELSLLVTSRFPLADLRDAHPGYFQTVPIEEIDVATGVQLLKDRGVHGNDLELEPIVVECGRHALTVDFAGGYISEFGAGNPSTPLKLDEAAELGEKADEELDDDRRAVLKQGRRFARIAERYREGMLEKDEAALALLERVCLFRLGVDHATLVAIFIGPDTTRISGSALAELNPEQVQQKLHWLVKMRIVEESKQRTKKGTTRTLYTIHPAVRDGFLSGIDRAVAIDGHESVRKGLEVSLGTTPGENPSDPGTLDLLEEIVYHAIQSDHVADAWDIFRNRIGGYENLGWRLGAYERGERICRAFAPGLPPETALQPIDSNDPGVNGLPYLALSENVQAVFINEWGLYLQHLGRLAAPARCYQITIKMWMRQEDWQNASIGNQNLCDVLYLAGRLRETSGPGAGATANQAVELAERADDAEERFSSYAYRAYVHALRGQVQPALADFQTALEWQRKAEGREDRPLYSGAGIWHTELLTRLGRRDEVLRLTQENQDLLTELFGKDDNDVPKCRLMIAQINIGLQDVSSAGQLCTKAHEWAAARDDKEVLCWSLLVQARIELARIDASGARGNNGATDNNDAPLASCARSLGDGLKIARDCGYGRYHIDLLLERARWHLHQGDPQAAHEDIQLALDEGIPANEESGQPELLAANDDACGYAWAIPFGFQLRAAAQLLQAAQLQKVDSFVPAKRHNLPPDIKALIESATLNLEEALKLWQPLHDPERDDQNFTHPTTGEIYNYRAAETYRILEELRDGLLTRYPIPTDSEETASAAAPTTKPGAEPAAKRFNVALSFPGEHRDYVEKVADGLVKSLTQSKVFYDDYYTAELSRPNLDTYLQKIYHDESDLIVVFLSAHYDEKEWCGLEFRAIRDLIKKKKDDEVMFVRLADGDVKGVFGIDGYVDGSRFSENQVADFICERLKLLQNQP